MKRKLPRKAKQWAKEAIAALETAYRLADAEYGGLTDEALENLYKYGPMLCAANRGLKDKEKIAEAAEHAFRDRLKDFSIDPESKKNYEINFFLAYLVAHEPLKLLSDRRVHEAMESIVERLNSQDSGR